MLSKDCVREAVYTYGDMLYRVCLVMLKNSADAEDAVQEIFITYMTKAPVFRGEEHEKAWLLTVASNRCKDMLRSRKRRSASDIDEIADQLPDKESTCILDALAALPEKFRIVLTLYYVEEYKVDEIAKIIEKTSSAVKMRLQKGRKLLEEKYRKEFV